MRSFILLALFAVPGYAQSAPLDLDSDGDGLSDFQERAKYFTDPAQADSDGDGVADGDWNERREFSYSVRTLVHVLPPVTRDVLNDDYQDARILLECPEYVELEVVHYPLNRVAEELAADPDWRNATAAMSEYLAPGPTANWDAAMRRELVARLKRDGIDVDTLDDKALVEQAAAWLVAHARSEDGFTTYCSTFESGSARVLAGLEQTVERECAKTGRSLEEQWQRELFAAGMFANGVRGTCTSSAIYMNGCLRALGIPTRIVLCTPLVDASDEHELDLLRRGIKHPGVRRIILNGVEPLGNSWASHTFNEVFVAGRWRRLNYQKLGQNILDENLFGLLTHVATFNDWADGELAKTWGTRQKLSDTSADIFGGSNPYSAIAVSDQLGVHAPVDLGADLIVEEFTKLTISHLYWYDSPERKRDVTMRLDDPDTAGHLLMHVDEFRPNESSTQYKHFYGQVSKQFVLRAEGRPDVPARAARGYWVNSKEDTREFYLRIEPSEIGAMDAGVPYTLIALNQDGPYEWVVADGLQITR